MSKVSGFSGLLHRGMTTLRLMPRAWKLVWESAKKAVLLWLLVLIVQAIAPVLTMFLVRRIVDAVASRQDIAGLLPEGLALLVLIFAVEGTRSVSEWIRTILGERVSDRVKREIHQVAIRADLALFENPEAYDRLYRANFESTDSVVTVFESIGNVVRGILVLPALLVVLYPFASWVPLAALSAACPAVLAMVYQARAYNRWWLQTTPQNRRADYLDWLLTSSDAALEMRAFGYGKKFSKSFSALREDLVVGRSALEARKARSMFVASAASLAVIAIALWRLVSASTTGALSVGDLVFCYQGIANSQAVAREVVSHGGVLIRSGLQLQALFKLLEDRPEAGAESSGSLCLDGHPASIEFRNVKFQYPGGHQPVLSGFSAVFPANKLTVVIGPNGAGKSSLLKLLLRLYDVDAGEILIAGRSIADVHPDGLRDSMSVVHQNAMHLQTSLRDYICCDRQDDERLAEVLRAVRMEDVIARLPQNLDSLLGRDFLDGVELSGGEWRKLAVARAIFRDSPVILFDEPTSALDPWAERTWLDELSQFLAGRTCIMVSHRLEVARRADHIVVVDKGIALASGGHKELVDACPLYRSIISPA
ncbi:MAG: ATP-binding cassette subfamily B protein [Verrucomicrobiales bacterium]|jgi:ATP-binding cassette subfamily B protein